MNSRDVKQIASRKFTHQTADGKTVEWQQEDESAVKDKAEAVAMVQRTIDFWLPKIADNLALHRNMPKAEAEILARRIFQENLTDMLTQPFAVKWNLTVEDFVLPQ